MTRIQQFTRAISDAATADEAFYQLYNYSQSHFETGACAYSLATHILSGHFPTSEIMSAGYGMALFDESDDDIALAKRARRFIALYQAFRRIPEFLGSLRTKGIAGYRSDQLLWVAHPCVKPGRYPYQVTLCE